VGGSTAGNDFGPSKRLKGDTWAGTGCRITSGRLKKCLTAVFRRAGRKCCKWRYTHQRMRETKRRLGHVRSQVWHRTYRNHTQERTSSLSPSNRKLPAEEKRRSMEVQKKRD
jgi:hypothetical protein